jgi:hypothetical protein
MNYAVEMGSSAMIYIQTLMKIGSDIQMLIRGGITDTRTTQAAWRLHKPALGN